MNTEGAQRIALLTGRKDALVRKWLERTLRTYPESTIRFLSQEKDTFRNPVGQTLKEGLSALLDGLIHETDAGGMSAILDGIVRMRAVQDFSASQAVGFIFLLKQVIREETKTDAALYANEVAVLEARIDEMALLAFDIFMKVRQQICDMRVKEVRHMMSLLEQERCLAEEETIG